MRLKRYILIIIAVLLLTQIFRIYNFWVKLANEEEFQFSFLFSGVTPNCVYQLNNWRFSLENCNNYQTGSEIRLIGRLTTSSDSQFQQTKKLNVKVLSIEKNQIISVISWFENWAKLMAGLRERVIQSLIGYLPAAHFSLIIDMPFGQIVDLPDQVYQQLKTIGMLHVVAASGYNVALISNLISKFSARFSRSQGLAIWGLGMICYLLFSDRSISILRATLMFILKLVAENKGHIYNSFNLLTTAVFLFLLFQPWFAFNLSFQLSVGATLGLILFAGLLTKFLNKMAGKFNCRWPLVQNYLIEPLATSMAAQLMTMPILLWHFGEVSVFSFVANVLLLWLAPVLTIGGLIYFGLGLLSLVAPFLSGLIGFYSLYLWLYTNVFITVAQSLAKLKLFQTTLTWERWPLALFCLAIMLIIIYNQARDEKKTPFSLDHYLAV